ncbi:citrate/2-methylcitrate synthase [Kitasatospora sp. LaBMicrA B282]|uniref:citrate/2-methylcitrate synthase n=1 Tax=Kitasatospora sp. LaBMicrA B282 TaxID=3420949 RepID=UPI003D0A159C
MHTADQLIARTLGIDVEAVTADLEYQSVREWDSLGHVALMVALENAHGVHIDDDLMLTLRSVAAIRAFVDGDRVDDAPAPVPERVPAAAPVPGAVPTLTVHRGLDGVVLDHTAITRIDGAEGVLEYRGYSIHDLARRASFEEVAHLLVEGELPDPGTLEVFGKELAARRELPGPVLDLVRSLAGAHPMDALRTCVSALGALRTPADRSRDESLAEAREVGLSLIAQVPMIVAAHHAVRSGREPIVPPAGLPYAEAFLTALLGEAPTPAAVRFVDKGFIVHADHSSNASTVAARVAVGCRAGMNSAVTAALAAFAGSVHGGAAERAVQVVDEVGAPEHAERYVAERFGSDQPVMGFGHRVYRTEDPRVRHLRETVVELSQERGDPRGLAILDAVAAAMRPYGRHGLAPNVDLYAGLAYRLLGLPDDLAIALFAIGRTAGWVAQALEQQANNVLIRPLLDYTGPISRPYPGAAA